MTVLEDVDEFSYCLDTNKMENDECPVIVWANEAGYGDKVADNFLQFFLEELEEAKENWEEDERLGLLSRSIAKLSSLFESFFCMK